MSDKGYLHPNEVWIHWGSTGTELALVATEKPVLGVTCTRFIRAARGDEPEQSDITPEERQVVELVRLMNKLAAGENECLRLRLYPPTKQCGIDGYAFDDYAGALTYVRDCLQPNSPQRPTSEEWYQAWNLPTGKERTTALVKLAGRHAAAKQWEAEQGK